MPEGFLSKANIKAELLIEGALLYGCNQGIKRTVEWMVKQENFK